MLADDPETLAKLDELYEAARYSFPLTEDHAFFIDQLFIGVFRRFVLAVGERLVAKGVFDAADDVFYLYRDELVDALTGGGDRHGIVAERPHELRSACRVTAPPRSVPRPLRRRCPTRSWTRWCTGCSESSRPRRTPNPSR